MSAREWLHSRTPRPPVALMARIDEQLTARHQQAMTDIPEALQTAGDRLLVDLLQRQASSRDSALDLLAVDALMTYMMESAAEDILTLGLHASAAMSRISEMLDDAPASE
jgi:hypothetical protein